MSTTAGNGPTITDRRGVRLNSNPMSCRGGGLAHRQARSGEIDPWTFPAVTRDAQAPQPPASGRGERRAVHDASPEWRTTVPSLTEAQKSEARRLSADGMIDSEIAAHFGGGVTRAAVTAALQGERTSPARASKERADRIAEMIAEGCQLDTICARLECPAASVRAVAKHRGLVIAPGGGKVPMARKGVPARRPAVPEPHGDEPLSEEERSEIIERLEFGETAAAICEDIGCSRKQVAEIEASMRLADETDAENAPHGGHTGLRGHASADGDTDRGGTTNEAAGGAEALAVVIAQRDQALADVEVLRQRLSFSVSSLHEAEEREAEERAEATRIDAARILEAVAHGAQIAEISRRAELPRCLELMCLKRMAVGAVEHAGDDWRNLDFDRNIIEEGADIVGYTVLKIDAGKAVLDERTLRGIRSIVDGLWFLGVL